METYGAEDDAVGVREKIASIWRAFDSVEYGSVEIVENQTEKYNSTTTIDFSWKNDGRSALSWTREMADKTSYLDDRDDGSKLTLSYFFSTPPKAVKQVLIRPSLNSHGHYGGKDFSSLWMLLPGGETIADLLNEGANLTNTGTLQSPCWLLKHRIKRFEIECVLDETHGYLPREMTALNGPNRRSVKVGRFEQADGFWYPAEGSATFFWAANDKDPSRTIHLNFRVARIAFNRSINPAKFILSEYPPGADVVNEIENTSTYVGGKLARTQLEREHPLPKQKVPTNPALKVPAEAGSGTRWWVETVLIGIAVLAGSLGLYFRVRGS